MEVLARLHARISSLTELRELFRAMRALAASHVQEAQGALDGIRRYTGVVERSIAQVVRLMDETGPPVPAPAARPPGTLVVICSEHGFTGAFNDRLLARARDEMEAVTRLAIVGQRGAVLARETGLAPAWIAPMATHVDGVLGVARTVAGRLDVAAPLCILHARYAKGGRYEVAARRVIPLDPRLFEAADHGSPPLHHLAPEVLLERLIGEYLLAETTLAAMESLASENAARLQIMEAADHNIGDRLERLTRDERVLRQEAITSELLDVVTGAEAARRESAPRPG